MLSDVGGLSSVEQEVVAVLLLDTDQCKICQETAAAAQRDSPAEPLSELGLSEFGLAQGEVAGTVFLAEPGPSNRSQAPGLT